VSRNERRALPLRHQRHRRVTVYVNTAPIIEFRRNGRGGHRAAAEKVTRQKIATRAEGRVPRGGGPSSLSEPMPIPEACRYVFKVRGTEPRRRCEPRAGVPRRCRSVASRSSTSQYERTQEPAPRRPVLALAMRPGWYDGQKRIAWPRAAPLPQAKDVLLSSTPPRPDDPVIPVSDGRRLCGARAPRRTRSSLLQMATAAVGGGDDHGVAL